MESIGKFKQTFLFFLSYSDFLYANGKCNKIHVTFRGLLPQASSLPGVRVVPLGLIECSLLYFLLPQYGDGLGKLQILVVELSGHVVYVLVNSALEFLLLMFYVVHPKADVAYSLAEFIITSSRE
jgi:hypothetical protein